MVTRGGTAVSSPVSYAALMVTCSSTAVSPPLGDTALVYDIPVPAAGPSPVCGPAHLPSVASMSQAVWQQGTAPPRDPHPCPPCHWHHPSPLCSSPLALLVAPTSHHSQPGGVCAAPRQGRLLSPPPAVPHFGVPAALRSPGLKVAPCPDSAAHPAGLCRLCRLSAAQDDTSPARGECPQGQRAGRGMCCPNCVTPR